MHVGFRIIQSRCIKSQLQYLKRILDYMLMNQKLSNRLCGFSKNSQIQQLGCARSAQEQIVAYCFGIGMSPVSLEKCRTFNSKFVCQTLLKIRKINKRRRIILQLPSHRSQTSAETTQYLTVQNIEWISLGFDLAPNDFFCSHPSKINYMINDVTRSS